MGKLIPNIKQIKCILSGSNVCLTQSPDIKNGVSSREAIGEEQLVEYFHDRRKMIAFRRKVHAEVSAR